MYHQSTNLTIRLAHFADVNSLVSLITAFRDHLGQSTPTDSDLLESIALLLQDTKTEFFLACNAQGDSLGYVQCRYRYSAWNSGFEAEIEDVFVVPIARRCGVGLRLVEYAIAQAIARGCRSIGLNTNERNQGAIALYRQLGFHSERSFWKGGQQLWLEKLLETT